MTQHLHQLAEAAGYPAAAEARLPKPVNGAQLADALGCWHVVEDSGGPWVAVVAGCPQQQLDAVVAGWADNPAYGRHPLYAKALLVAGGREVFTGPEVQQLLAHLVLQVLP